MKKFSKIMALSMALALTLGMTVFADGSSDPGAIMAQDAQETTVSATDAKGNPVSVNVEVKEATGAATPANINAAVENADSALTVAIKNASKYGEIHTPTLVTSIDINVTAASPLGDGTSFKVHVPCSYVRALQGGTKYVLMHLNNGVWEAVDSLVVGDGYFEFTTTSFSNYALFLVDEVVPTNGGDGGQGSTSADTPAPASEPVSPKTGESVPVAGFAALILLAGAAVCAKKAQFNN